MSHVACRIPHVECALAQLLAEPAGNLSESGARTPEKRGRAIHIFPSKKPTLEIRHASVNTCNVRSSRHLRGAGDYADLQIWTRGEKTPRFMRLRQGLLQIDMSNVRVTLRRDGPLQEQ